MGERTVIVAYGSQTGNSEFIAKDISDKILELGLLCRCQTLNSIKKADIKSEALFLVIVCSTTGNGDSPENAEQWWRSIKLRSASKDMFHDIPFAILGLGDSNYDKFCHMGKLIDKRLGELGGLRRIDLNCADEATNLEEVVEGWKVLILSELETLADYLAAPSPVGDLVAVIDLNADSPGSDGIKESSLDISVVTKPKVSLSLLQESLPAGVMGMMNIINWLDLNSALENKPDATLLPKSKKITHGLTFGSSTAVAEVATDNSNSTSNNDDSQHYHWTSEHPFKSQITSANWLTTTKDFESEGWGENRRVIHAQLSLRGSGITYNPGDSIGICCPNPLYLVKIVLERLQEAHKSDFEDQGTILSLETQVVDKANNSSISLGELLTYKVDLTCPPRKLILHSLSQYCRDLKESIFLDWLCSKSDIGKVLWSQFIECQRLGIAELLSLLPSCCPPLSVLNSVFSLMPPRYYSIAASPLCHPTELGFAFSIVHYECGLTVPSTQAATTPAPVLKRYGVCTSYLEAILKPWLRPEETEGNNSDKTLFLRIFHKPTLSFRLPASVASPLILIGPGTGVAPFIGFLEHRAQLEIERLKAGEEISTGIWRGDFEFQQLDLPSESNHIGAFIKSVSPGPVLMFFGCRSFDDFLYQPVLEKFVADKTLTMLEVAMSRIGPEKVYVTNKLKTRGQEVARLILHEGAYVYVCGDGNSMAKDVYDTIKTILTDFGEQSVDQAEEFLNDMRQRRKYLLDVWS